MNVSRILCALLSCGSLAIEANAAVSPMGSRSPQTMAESTAGRDVHAEARPADGRALARPAAETTAHATNRAGAANRDAAMAVESRSMTMQHPVGQVGRGNADRLRSLLGAQARGRVARQPTRPSVGSARAPTIGGSTGQERFGGNPAQFGAGPVRQPSQRVGQPVGSLALASLPKTARPAPTLSALATHSTNGARRAPGLAVVGGPVIGRDVHNSTIDGTQARHKF